jgi:hypothetical protein
MDDDVVTPGDHGDGTGELAAPDPGGDRIT